MSSMFYFLGKQAFDDTQNYQNWIVDQGLNINDTFTMYLNSIYFVFISMITIGYGDIIPVNNQEKVFVMFMSIFSTAFFGYSIQKISEIFGDIVSKRKKLENQKYAVQKYLNDRVENELLLHKIVDNLEQSFKNNDDVIQLGQSIIEKIDQNLNMEFKQEFFGKIIQNFKPFQMNFGKQTLEQLSQHMFEKIIEKDQVIFQKGQLSENLFMLVKGEIQIYNQEPQTKVIYQLGNIKKGKFFGVNPFIADLSYEYSTKAKTDCHIIYCSKQDFNSIIKQSFQDYENLRKIKDEIIFNNKSFFTGIECLGCGEQDHTIQFCPQLHVQPKKYSQEQYERKFQERKYPQKYSSLNNQDIVQNNVKKIRLDQLQQIYQHNFNENQVKQLMSSKLDHKEFFTILPIIRQETLKQDYINELKMIHGDHWLNHYNQFKDSEEDQEFSDLNIFGSSMGSSQDSSLDSSSSSNSNSNSNSNSVSSSFNQQQNQQNFYSDENLNSVVIEENQSLDSSSNIQQISQQFEQGKQDKNPQNEMNISNDLNLKIMNKSDRNVNHNSQQLSNSSANKLSLSKSISQKQIQSQEDEKMNLSKSEKKKRKKSNYLNTSNNNDQNQNIDQNLESNFGVITNNDNNQFKIENMENNANRYQFNQNHLIHKNNQIMTDQSQNKDGEKNLNSSQILKKSNQKRQQQKIVKCIVQSVLEKLTGISGTDYFENQENIINSLNDSFQSNYQTPQNQNNNNNSNLRNSLNKKNNLPDSKRKKTQFKDVLQTRNQLQQSKKLTYIFNDKKIYNQMEESKHFKNPALESKIAQNIENQQSRLFQQLRKQSKKLSINSINEQQQQTQQNKSQFYRQQKEQMHTKNLDIQKNNRKTMIKKPTFLTNNLAQNLNNNFNNLNYNQYWDQQIQQQQYLMQQQKQQQQQYPIINSNNIDSNNSGFNFQNQNHILKKQNSISLQHQNSIQSYGNLQSVGQLEQMSQQNQQNNNISIKKLNANNAYQNLAYSHQRGTLGNNEINIDLINNDQYLKTRFYYYFIDQPKEFKYYFPHNNQSEVLMKEKQLFQARQLQILIIKKSNMYNSKQGPSTTSHKMKNSYINAKGLQQSYQSNETPQNNVKGMQGSWGSMQSSNKLLKKFKKNKKKVINLDSIGNTIN
ncbi:Cyclic nucleotide-binding protein [Pseudocohnilembus persalinus]|uniref:Cyclic nucleotide-binding protein n=1 Tax=Pseudocohnilembus persalinus TaxID=266149 RepID=A0A0V0QKN0_PSEPJ|nr:Cyclic nucleotide-binding protein [Pseudocohnilembus persalinus]|eukprot:KRX02666.1 Cyclic nucleotide-binding protein [Pseudocohnilembus persalinus]